MLETGGPPNAREKPLSRDFHLPREKGREPYRLPPLPLLLMDTWRKSWEPCLPPPLGRENLKFVFLFCFYRQSPMRATKISHKNTCLLKQRPKLPRRSTIYLYHAAGLGELSQHLTEKQRNVTPVTVYWYNHHWDSGENCFSLLGELEGRVLLLFCHLSGWLVTSWTASPAVPPSPPLCLPGSTTQPTSLEASHRAFSVSILWPHADTSLFRIGSFIYTGQIRVLLSGLESGPEKVKEVLSGVAKISNV